MVRQANRWTWLIPGAVAALCATGCTNHFEVHRAELGNNNLLRILDPNPVPVPDHAPSSIPVYWKDYGQRQANGASMPELPYEVIGRARGVVGVAAQNAAMIDTQFRRTAAALGGDAIIEARKGAWIPKPPGNEYIGRIIKWKRATSAPSQ